MTCIPRVLRLLALAAAALSLASAAHAFGGFGAQPLPDGGVGVGLTTETRWRDDGGARVEVRVAVRGDASGSRSGELRVVLVGVNGRIDFDAVAVRLLRDSAREALPAEAGQPKRGFLVIPDFDVAAGGERHLAVEVGLPAKTRQSGVPLQVIVVARGQLPGGGGEWMSSAREMVAGSGAFVAPPVATSPSPGAPGESPRPQPIDGSTDARAE